MSTRKIQFWLGPLFVSSIFILYQLNQLRIAKKHEQQMNEVYGFVLKETSKEANLSHFHHSQITTSALSKISPWINSIGASVTVSDINNDEFQDVLLTDTSIQNKLTLFINDQHGKFIDKTHEFKLDNILFPYPILRAISFDCNNDGFPDLFLLSNCPQLLINRNGKYYEDYTAQSGIQKCSYLGTAANAFDYDKDGNLDVVWASYYSADFVSSGKFSSGILPDNFMDSKNAAQIFLMMGDGQCHFADKSNLIPKDKLHGWFWDIGIQDIFQNGNQDILIASDYGINNLLKYVSNSKGWSDESHLLDQASISRNNMGVSFSDVSHNKVVSTYITSIFQNREKISGNLLWTYDKEKKEFKEEAQGYNIASCGWSWGSQFIDLNNDGWDDLVTVNGLFGDGTKKSYWYNLSVLDSAGRTFMSDLKNWPDMNGYDLDGGQRDCILINQGKQKKFLDVTNSTIFDQDKKNGRSIAYIDINNDGIYSLIVANQNDISHLYKVIPTNPYKWIGLCLHGYKENSAAYGAKVFWRLSDGSESFKEMRPIQGFSTQNDPRFRLGFPENISLAELNIIWLDGEKQVLDLKSLKINQYNNIQKAH